MGEGKVSVIGTRKAGRKTKEELIKGRKKGRNMMGEGKVSVMGKRQTEGARKVGRENKEELIKGRKEGRGWVKERYQL